MKSLMKLFLTFIIFACSYSTTLAGGYKVGDIVTDFSLKNVDGSMLSLEKLSNIKGCIVVFTCNHCPYSVAYENRIIELHKQYAPKGFPVVAINPNPGSVVPEDSYENMVKRAKDKQYPFAYVYDETQAIAKQFGATRTPHTFLVVKENGKFVVRYIGAIDNNSDNADQADQKYVQNAIASITKGVKPDPDFTKAIGCSIKWSTK